MSTQDVIALIGLLVVIAGLFAGQWTALQAQRSKDQEANRLIVDALRTHTDMAIGEVHDRINRAAETTKSDIAITDQRFREIINRFDDKLDRMSEKLDRMIVARHP